MANAAIALIFSGVHEPELTRQWIRHSGLTLDRRRTFVVEPHPWALVEAHNLITIASQHQTVSEVLWCGFSLGTLWAIAGSRCWYGRGGGGATVLVDSWAVPLWGLQTHFSQPVIHLSHDFLTHGQAQILGLTSGFFADPPCSHRQLWQRPDRIQGQEFPTSSTGKNTTAQDYLHRKLPQYFRGRSPDLFSEKKPNS